ncbi:hypothetical protein PROFUN_01524 [Planoprotostelium fungivorum]|uniref:Uncharacterized protein n=1 Tax=Planoprotostelium fungivorum TaxID=1890364 RepID=A0A2P6NTH2_9EUKA|nr:hypothetical protein PROFUN_01524 [Planoprotostelium fungivorum]
MTNDFNSLDIETTIIEWIEKKWKEETKSHVPCPIVPLFGHSDDFELLQPLKIMQRKSYDGENRFLCPKPIIVLKPGKIISCNVTVKLLDEKDCALDLKDQACLSRPNDEQMDLLLERTPPMSIRISHRFEKIKAKLCFLVDYETLDSTSHCLIISDSFHFLRDRRRNASSLTAARLVRRLRSTGPVTRSHQDESSS